MTGVIDYGVGNLYSLLCSLRYLGADAVITSDPRTLRDCRRIILPGVGAFRDAANKLRGTGLADFVVEEARRGKPLLGVCLGMQLLFEKSYEFGEHDGLSLLPGAVRPIRDYIPRGLKIPHIGWNALTLTGNATPLLKYIRGGESVYFVHSYHAADCDGCVTATAEYGEELTAAVGRDNVMGTQFHPEKSGDVGLNILRAFSEMM